MRSGALIWQQRCTVILLASAAVSIGRFTLADAYDPPAGYYSTATGVGATLKTQLHKLIDAVDDAGINDVVSTPLSYDSARSNLQITDADPAHAGHMLTVYDRMSLDLSTIGPVSGIPGWDGGTTWNREHTWPRSRGVGSSGPDDSDLFALRPAFTDNNGDRGNLNYGGDFGQPFGVVPGGIYYYPGDIDAGMIARQEFYMAVRYDGTDANTTDLELFSGNATTAQGLGDFDALLKWHYIVPPDSFERRRNQVIFDNYQHNRNPFTDHPEYVWSVFKGNNNSQISISGSTVNSNGSSAKNIDLGRVFVGGSVPGGQNVVLAKAGLDGTYYEITTSGAATSTVTGRFNAFRTGQTDNKTINVGLNTTTASTGLKSGTVTIDNLDVSTTTANMVVQPVGAGDANDTVNVSLTVLDHATPSFVGGSTVTTLMHDFGSVAMGSAAPSFNFD